MLRLWGGEEFFGDSLELEVEVAVDLTAAGEDSAAAGGEGGVFDELDVLEVGPLGLDAREDVGEGLFLGGVDGDLDVGAVDDEAEGFVDVVDRDLGVELALALGDALGDGDGEADDGLAGFGFEGEAGGVELLSGLGEGGD